MNKAQKTLAYMGYPRCECELIHEKDGVAVWRARSRQQSYILKTFERVEDRREIRFYEILRECGVPTIRVLARTEDALLLEDLKCYPVWRLGRAVDMDSPQVARALAAWYRALHAAGRRFPALHELPADTDALTEDNLGVLSGIFPDETFWPRLLAGYDKFRQRLDALPKTLTYNDFYWTNLAVARDGSAALLFDYNCAGRDYAYGDVRNVTSSLSESAGRAFLAAYGEINPAERAMDAVAADLFSLWDAVRRKRSPQWIEDLLARLADGTLLRNLEAIL
jgi:hypothetical protein